jgi:hypothetical protein
MNAIVEVSTVDLRGDFNSPSAGAPQPRACQGMGSKLVPAHAALSFYSSWAPYAANSVPASRLGLDESARLSFPQSIVTDTLLLLTHATPSHTRKNKSYLVGGYSDGANHSYTTG